MIRKLSILYMLLFICFAQIGKVEAQNKKLEKANEVYGKFAFLEAGKLYQELVDKGNTSIDVFTKLGNCYYFNANYGEAAMAYSKVLDLNNNVDPVYYFRYAQSLNNLQKYEESYGVIKKYYEKIGKIKEGENWDEKKLMAAIQKQSGRYSLKNIDINSPFSDFGTSFLGKDKVVYTSAKDTGVIIKRKHSWNDKSFLKLYTADITSDGGLTNPVKVKGDVNTRYHQSTAAVTKDGKYMFFTRNNYSDGKLGADRNGTNFLKIYVAENVNGEWKNVKELPYPINSDGFSSAHPALSPDESQLYFVSDRNNKFGNSDLYVVSLKKGGIIGNDVTKLPDEINTPGRETYPFMDEKGILYFASDGHPGLGGLDVFAAIKDLSGNYHVVNLGDGVNTTFDDFAYTINSDMKGFFSSDRSGNDDIYGFVENKPVTFDFDIRALVYGTISESGKPVADLTIEIFNSKNEVVAASKTDADGKYSIPLDPFLSYKAVYHKIGLANRTIDVSPLKALEKKEISFELVKEMEVVVNGNIVTIAPGENLHEKLNLDPIYFDLNGYNIRTSSKKELDKVVQVMKDRPILTLKVNSYTDSRGRDDFNMKLSQNRAQATVDYIIKAGIAPERIKGEGFGETRLLNHCSNGVPCSEKEHEVNRRSEFIVNF
ncbi:OmpA family protein [Flavobacterium artemisiae]